LDFLFYICASKEFKEIHGIIIWVRRGGVKSCPYLKKPQPSGFKLVIRLGAPLGLGLKYIDRVNVLAIMPKHFGEHHSERMTIAKYFAPIS